VHAIGFPTGWVGDQELCYGKGFRCVYICRDEKDDTGELRTGTRVGRAKFMQCLE